MTRIALVAGGTGHVGSQLVNILSAVGGWQVVALGRRSLPPLPHVQSLSVDLLSGDLEAALASSPKPTHVFYCVRAPHNETGSEDVETNLAMLCRVVEEAARDNPHLSHVHLVEGGKWYGSHLGSYQTPAREDDPRHAGPNFYYSQEDWLRERQRGQRWTWSASRPSYVCAATPRQGRNLVSILGAYAALCREAGAALDFPGSAASFASLTEVTDGQLLARAMIYVSTVDAGANQAFNVTNGDYFRWCEVWPVLADYYGLRLGRPAPVRLVDWSKGQHERWLAIRARHALVDMTLAEVANWAFVDFVFAQEHDVASDTSKLRAAGFREAIDSTDMILRILGEYRSLRILP